MLPGVITDRDSYLKYSSLVRVRGMIDSYHEIAVVGALFRQQGCVTGLKRSGKQLSPRERHYRYYTGINKMILFALMREPCVVDLEYASLSNKESLTCLELFIVGKVSTSSLDLI